MSWSQLQTMLWLRWRLTVNQWRRHGQISRVITVLMAVLGACLAAAGGVAGLAAGAFALPHQTPQTIMFVWDGLVAGFLFFWASAIVAEVQRSEIIDLSRLLHLPVSLKNVFFLNYLASHLSFTLALFMPAMLGLVIGMVLGGQVATALLLPVVFGFIFMITSWTYHLRGWLAALMVNKRRRRAIVMAITLTFILLAQLPNLIANVWLVDQRTRNSGMPAIARTASQNEAKKARVMAIINVAHCGVPFLWLPIGAKAVAEGRILVAAGGALGMIALGAWGLLRAYRGTLRFYQGGETAKSKPVQPVVASRRRGRRLLVERTLPCVPEEATALAFANLRSMLRAPEVKMALVANVAIFVILGAGLLVRRGSSMPMAARPFAAAGVVAITFTGLMNVMFNVFGFDRSGFRLMVLLPASRRDMLLGKNLSMLPLAAVLFAVFIGLVTALARLGILDILAATLEFLGAFLILSAIGNVTSILSPCRIAPGSMKPTKLKGVDQLVFFVIRLLFPIAMLPVFVPPLVGFLCDKVDLIPGGVATLGCAALMAVVAAFIYRRTLAPLGRLLERREQSILQAVTQEVE